MNRIFQDSDFETDIFALTDKGDKELRGAETSLSPAELDLLVRIDGSSTVAQIRASVQPLDEQIFRKTLKQFFLDGLIDVLWKTQTDSLGFTNFFGENLFLQAPRKALTEATKEAATGLPTLRQQGYYVRIARRAPTERKLAPDQILSVVIIEDDLNVAKFLKHLLAFEHYDVRIASNRDEIVRELRRTPSPDLVLLDVGLPDVDGFDVLLRMRQHPVLKTVPIIMLTAMATREAVLKGLAGGADGYITKPFDAEILNKALNAVLGLDRQKKDRKPRADPWA
ncbi:MAG: response regulator transcription factor [Burkholderiales bacterium]